MSTDQDTRKRVAKACDLCRARKLKCDGALPSCSRCRNNETECSYTHIHKRRQTARKPKKNSSVQSLDARMSKLESLMYTLVEKLDSDGSPGVRNGSGQRTTTSTPDRSSGTDSYYEDDDNHEHSTNNAAPDGALGDDDEDVDEEDEVDPSPELERDFCDTNNVRTDDPNDVPHHKYIGSQSSLSVMSAKGLMWLIKRSGDPHIFNDFKFLHGKIAKLFVKTNKMWLDPIEKSQLTPIPPKRIAQPMVESFFTQVAFPNFIFKKSEFYDIFNRFYDPRVSTPGKNMTNSDLMCMNIVIAMGALFRVDAEVSLHSDKLAFLKNLQDRHIENALYYYSRLTIIGEGLRTIQAFLLLVFYAEFAKGTPHPYMIVSSAVRYAQELGLHRKESMVGMSEEEAMIRRRIWLNVYFFDRDCCLKMGKPPIINDSDVSSLTPADYETILFRDLGPAELAHLKSDDANLGELLDPNHENVVARKTAFMMAIVRSICYYFDFSSDVYKRLFSANSLNDKTDDQVFQLIDQLNDELEFVRLKIPKSIRPGVTGSGSLSPTSNHDIYFLHFQHYLQVMIVNRMAFKRGWLNSDHVKAEDRAPISPLQRKLMDRSLEAARSMMVLIQKIDVNPLFFNYVAFQLFSAFFTLFTGLLECPSSEYFQRDLQLINETKDKFFKRFSPFAEQLGDACSVNIIAYVIRFFLRIAILAHNHDYPDKKLDTSQLDQELEYYAKLVTTLSEGNDSNKVGKPQPVFDPIRNLDGVDANINSRLQQQQPSNPIDQQHPRGSISMMMNNSMPHQPVPNPLYQQANNFPNQMPGAQQYFPGTPPYPQNFRNPSSSTTTPSCQNTDSPNDPLYDRFDLGEYETDKSTNILQQIFGVPNIYLDSNEMQSLDNFDFTAGMGM